MKRLVLVLFCLLLMTAAAYAQEGGAVKDTFEVIHSRKSVRNFTGKPVAKSDLERIVRTGMAAPTAVDKRPWSFVVVTDRKQLDALGAGLPYAKMLAKAGAAVIVCTEPQKAFEGNKDFAVIDASLAGENILLATEALGLGGVWTAAYPDGDRMKHVRATLGIPENIVPLTVIPIGHPTGEDKPKDKFDKAAIHWERW